MALDILGWLVMRTDLRGAALSMIVKEGIVIVGVLCNGRARKDESSWQPKAVHRTDAGAC